MQEYKKYLIGLDRKSIPDGLLLEFSKKGCSFFEYLYDQVEVGSLSARQSVNAFMIMFDMLKEHCPEKRVDLYRLSLKKSTDDDLDVRSLASYIVIRLVLFSEKVPEAGLKEISRNEASLTIKKSLSMGLQNNYLSYTEEFLSGKV